MPNSGWDFTWYKPGDWLHLIAKINWCNQNGMKYHTNLNNKRWNISWKKQ